MEILNQEELRNKSPKDILTLQLILSYEDYVICGLCGRQFKGVTNTHLKSHSISKKEYQIRFGIGNMVNNRNKRASKEIAKNMTQSRVIKQKAGIIKYPVLSKEKRLEFSKRMFDNNPMKNKEISKKTHSSENMMKHYANGGGLAIYYSNKENIEKLRQRMINNNPMKREEVWKKSILKHNREKSSIETWFEAFCKKYNFPFLYCGNNKIWINGKNPDFIFNKKVIEMSSNYKGRNETYDKLRIEHFRKNGFDCMVITLWHIPLDLKDSIERFLYEELNIFLNRTSFEDIRMITVPDFSGKIRMRVAI